MIERRRRERRVVVAGDCESDERRLRERDGRGAHLRPARSVARLIRGQGAAAAIEPHPSRRRNARRRRVHRCPVRGGAAAERDTVCGRHEHEAMDRARVRSRPEHHARLRPGIGVREARHAGDDRAVAIQCLIHVMERVGGAPDISPRGVDRKRAGGARILSAAGYADVADVALRPTIGQGAATAATTATATAAAGRGEAPHRSRLRQVRAGPRDNFPVVGCPRLQRAIRHHEALKQLTTRRA